MKSIHNRGAKELKRELRYKRNLRERQKAQKAQIDKGIHLFSFTTGISLPIKESLQDMVDIMNEEKMSEMSLKDYREYLEHGGEVISLSHEMEMLKTERAPIQKEIVALLEEKKCFNYKDRLRLLDMREHPHLVKLPGWKNGVFCPIDTFKYHEEVDIRNFKISVLKGDMKRMIQDSRFYWFLREEIGEEMKKIILLSRRENDICKNLTSMTAKQHKDAIEMWEWIIKVKAFAYGSKKHSKPRKSCQNTLNLLHSNELFVCTGYKKK